MAAQETKVPRLMSLQQVADRLAISKSSIIRGDLGTRDLTRIRPGGGRRLLFIEAEVEQLIATWIADTERQKPEQVVLRRFSR
jgi:predicted DNA-binding transcriptional regulator AlpA